ncbi:hypothetical protein RAC89_30275 [Paenibacillus sp. GD4]|jgi:hypothetical protein|uniref:hypothetical protein n=1 Tax=Paenibacillus TaxID=44249 RepID=UPI00254378D0|nr:MULTISPECIES: hypothetical protein [Paenibacillus]MDQ1914672.1 hypothetical protein [Paenibacillus sp. GD4]
MNSKKEDNEKELAFLKEQLGINNPSPDQLKKALKELASRKVISKFTIKSDKE